MNEFTLFEIAVALARLEYGVTLTEYNKLVLDVASNDLLTAQEAVMEMEDDLISA